MNLLESKFTLLPKETFFLMTCSTSMQIYKKSGCQKAFVSKVQTELINHSFKTSIVSRFRLMLNPLWNSITSPIWGVRFYMSTRSDIQVYRSPWRAPCPSLSFGEFILEVTISLSDQLFPEPFP
jgi:hypothetical protein